MSKALHEFGRLSLFLPANQKPTGYGVCWEESGQRLQNVKPEPPQKLKHADCYITRTASTSCLSLFPATSIPASALDKPDFTIMAGLKGTLAKYNVANKLYKQSLLQSVCLVSGISMFFFGYDQGLMGGINAARNYAELMGFGHWDEAQQMVVVDKPLLQGGLVSGPFDCLSFRPELSKMLWIRLRCIICPEP